MLISKNKLKLGDDFWIGNKNLGQCLDEEQVIKLAMYLIYEDPQRDDIIEVLKEFRYRHNLEYNL